MSLQSSGDRTKKRNLLWIIFYLYLQLLIYNKSLVYDLYIFVQDLILFRTRIPSFLCYIQVFHLHFHHNTLLLDLKSDIPPLLHFHLVISPLCFQIAHQTRRQNPHYRRQHPAESVKVKCLQMTIFVVHS